MSSCNLAGKTLLHREKDSSTFWCLNPDYFVHSSQGPANSSCRSCEAVGCGEPWPAGWQVWNCLKAWDEEINPKFGGVQTRRSRTVHICLGVIPGKGQREMNSCVFAEEIKWTCFMDSASKHECTEDTFRSCCRFIVYIKIVLSVFPPRPGFLAVLLSSCELHRCLLAAPWSVDTLPPERCQSWMLYISARDILILKKGCFMVLWATLLFVVFTFFFPNSMIVLTYIRSISDSL